MQQRLDHATQHRRIHITTDNHRQPPGSSISIRPAIGTATACAGAWGGTSFDMIAGTNAADPPNAFTLAPYRRRHVKTRFVLTSCRLATTDTDAPGSKLSATIRRLSSSDHRRRSTLPPADSTSPVIASVHLS
jgi:hypothetical protein